MGRYLHYFSRTILVFNQNCNIHMTSKNNSLSKHASSFIKSYSLFFTNCPVWWNPALVAVLWDPMWGNEFIWGGTKKNQIYKDLKRIIMSTKYLSSPACFFFLCWKRQHTFVSRDPVFFTLTFYVLVFNVIQYKVACLCVWIHDYVWGYKLMMNSSNENEDNFENLSMWNRGFFRL